MNDYFIKLLSIFCIVSIIFMGIITIGIDQHQEYKCNNYSKVTNKEVKYKHFDACYVKVGNTYQRWNEYLYRSATNQSEGE